MPKIQFSAAYWFILPAMLFFILLAIYPSAFVLFLSFFATGKGIAVSANHPSFANFLDVWKNVNFGKFMLQTFIYAGGATLLHALLGFIFALILNILPLNPVFTRTMRTVFLIPWAITPTVVAILFRILLSPQVGPISIYLKSIGSPIVFGPLGQPEWALLAVTLTNVWMFTPFYMLMILSAMQAIDPGIYEAAVVDGANGPQQIFFITIPMIKNTLLTLGMFDFVTTAGYFDLTWIMTQGGPVKSSEIISTWVYRTAFQSFEFGEASAIGMILFSISVIVSIIVLRAINKE
ncbi:MAG: sugar ABC transporter permease [Anaerolineales bacterium]|uniref:Sugar ABC transporter permease n=1 Tax=Candidatus Desulfolinea nitratireducens TaxID=2841698 RepID=A0A8J6TFK3_9CHLR|nr:sugar ABC transporter permease [Candidatus Desulfolinea nitratireducens]MBL6959954.1 sugar ABC transporter permease [Anaerolineales bacterium]